MISFYPQVFYLKKIGKEGEDSLFEGMPYLFSFLKGVNASKFWTELH